MHLLQVLQNVSKRSLMPWVHVPNVLIEHEFPFIPAVDGIVGEVHVHVGHVLLGRGFVGISGETGEAFFEQVDAHGVDWEK